MGRPPCCDKVGIKKGPWTPEEDIILVSYIQEHGPGNWRSVPTNTGNILVLLCLIPCLSEYQTLYGVIIFLVKLLMNEGPGSFLARLQG